MKKTLILMALACLAFVGCRRNATTYTLIYDWNNADILASIDGDDIRITVDLLEFDASNNQIASTSIDSAVTNTSYTFEADDRAQQVKVQYREIVRQDNRWYGLDNYKCSTGAYQLKDGDNIDIVISEVQFR